MSNVIHFGPPPREVDRSSTRHVGASGEFEGSDGEMAFGGLRCGLGSAALVESGKILLDSARLTLLLGSVELV